MTAIRSADQVIDLYKEKENPMKLTSRTITRVDTQTSEQVGVLCATSEEYIAYVLKQKLIRVLHLSTKRCLLRATSTICAIEIDQRSDNLTTVTPAQICVSCVCEDGAIFVWRLRAEEDTIVVETQFEGNLYHEMNLDTTFPATKHCLLPFQNQTLFAGNHFIRKFSGSLEPEWSIEEKSGKIVSMAVLGEGEVVVVTDIGVVSKIAVGEGGYEVTGQVELDIGLQQVFAYTGTSSYLVIIGGDKGECIRILSTSLDVLQTLQFTDLEIFSLFGQFIPLEKKEAILLLGDRNNGRILSVGLEEGSSGLRMGVFHYATIGQPIVSFTMMDVNCRIMDDMMMDFNRNLFCIQRNAVQIYPIVLSEVRLSSFRCDAPPPEVSKPDVTVVKAAPTPKRAKGRSVEGEAVIKTMIALHRKQEETMRELMTKTLKEQLHASLHHLLSQQKIELAKIVRSEVRTQLEEAQSALLAALVPHLLEIGNKVGLDHPHSIPVSLSEAELRAAVENPVKRAFDEAFNRTLIPAYEKASQQMFHQMHSSFRLGLDEFVRQLPPK